ncbi:hypothetical protein [Flavobacterium sp. FlaQc-48]|uniref:hypothetical protein n=1 Tax=Flavobacterium sp. FlaQc-48 TaxID=3374181 RepID=UPI003756EA30
MENTNTETRINIKKDNKAILKFGFGFTAFLSLVATGGFAFIGILQIKEDILFSLLFFGLAILLYIIAKKYIASTFYDEYVIVDETILKVVYKSLGKFQETRFELKEIRHIKYVGEENFTKHPLDNETMDYLGFGAAEKEMQYLISEGTIEIKSDETEFRFGKNIPSWEAERVISAIKAIVKL